MNRAGFKRLLARLRRMTRGRALSHALDRNRRAAAELDAVVREVLHR